MAQAYNPSAYSTSAHYVNSSLRNWSFNEVEDRPVAYLVTPGSGDRSVRNCQSVGRNSNNGRTDDSALRAFLRNARIPMNPQSSRYKPRQNNSWEKYSQDAYMLGVSANEEFAKNGIYGPRGSFHSKMRGHEHDKVRGR